MRIPLSTIELPLDRQVTFELLNYQWCRTDTIRKIVNWDLKSEWVFEIIQELRALHRRKRQDALHSPHIDFEYFRFSCLSFCQKDSKDCKKKSCFDQKSCEETNLHFSYKSTFISQHNNFHIFQYQNSLQINSAHTK